jgi:hypothetical protein
MHTISGAIKDTCIKCPQLLRTSIATRKYDIEHNRKFKDDDDRPWQATVNDMTRMKEALKVSQSMLISVSS